MARLDSVLCLALASLTLAGCKTIDEPDGRRRAQRDAEAAIDPAPRPAAAPLPWPGDFEQPAVLMAARVVVVGPEGLREHAAIRQDFAHHTYEEKTTSEGFVRRTALRDDIGYLAPIRCVLDGLEIFAERELVVLEKPGPVRVSIEAVGDVFYRVTDTGEEQRHARLTLTSGPR